MQQTLSSVSNQRKTTGIITRLTHMPQKRSNEKNHFVAVFVPKLGTH